MASKSPPSDPCRVLELAVLRDMTISNAGRLQTALNSLAQLQSLKLKPRPHMVIGSHVQGFYLTADVLTMETCIRRILTTRIADDLRIAKAVLESRGAVLVQTDMRLWELRLDIGIVRIVL